MLNVLLVDDEWPVLRMLANVIGKHTAMRVAGTIARSSEVVAAVEALRPDVVFLDIEMPGINGLELAVLLTEAHPELEIVMVTAFREYALQAYQANAIDYLLKPVDAAAIVRCEAKLRKRLSSPGTGPKPAAATRTVGLGGFRIYAAEDADPVHFATLKAEELMAYSLIHRHNGLTKEELCEALWPNFDPVKSEQNLYTTIYRLRKLIAGAGLTIRIEYRLGRYWVTGCDNCDFILFQTWATAGMKGAEGEETRRLMEAAVALYGGPLFEGKGYAWAESERVRLERQFLKMAKRLFEYYAAGGDEARAADLLAQALDKAVCDEEGYRLLLELYARRQDAIGFANTFDELRRRLAEELELEPEPHLHELYDRVNKI